MVSKIKYSTFLPTKPLQIKLCHPKCAKTRLRWFKTQKCFLPAVGFPPSALQFQVSDSTDATRIVHAIQRSRFISMKASSYFYTKIEKGTSLLPSNVGMVFSDVLRSIIRFIWLTLAISRLRLTGNVRPMAWQFCSPGSVHCLESVHKLIFRMILYCRQKICTSLTASRSSGRSLRFSPGHLTCHDLV